MGRWGGRELSYASDADAMFVMADPREGEPQAEDPTRAAAAVIAQLRKLLSRPGADPALSVDADLRPGGQGRCAHPLARRLPELLPALVLDLGAAGARPRGRAGAATPRSAPG